jgi:hypothetical protein
MIETYGKESHRAALRSAETLRGQLPQQVIATSVFQASATDDKTIAKNIRDKSVDIVFTDVPYGLHSRWQSTNEAANPIWSMLDALLNVLSSSSIVAIVSDKGQKAAHERYQRLEHFQLGKRRVTILRSV